MNSGTPIDWQLQHGRVLTFAQMSQQHDLAIGELQRIMMDLRLVLVDLPESSHLVSNLAQWLPKTDGLILHVLLEGEFGAGKQAYGHMPLSDSGETIREPLEPSRYQRLADLCRPRRDV